MSVFIAIPSVGASIHSKLVTNLLGQLAGNEVCIITGEKPIARARNTIVERFLESKSTHLWMIDDSTIPPKNALKTLLSLQKPIVTGITPMVVEDKELHYNVFLETKGELLPLPFTDPRFRGKPLPFRVDACGTSCILIERSVIEKMSHPYFCDVWFQDGKYCSEDIFFCNGAREAGYEITAVPEVRCLTSRYVVV